MLKGGLRWGLRVGGWEGCLEEESLGKEGLCMRGLLGRERKNGGSRQKGSCRQLWEGRYEVEASCGGHPSFLARAHPDRQTRRGRAEASMNTYGLVEGLVS